MQTEVNWEKVQGRDKKTIKCKLDGLSWFWPDFWHTSSLHASNEISFTINPMMISLEPRENLTMKDTWFTQIIRLRIDLQGEALERHYKRFRERMTRFSSDKILLRILLGIVFSQF